MAKVTVLTDSVACVSSELRDKLGIGMVAIHIVLDGEEYRDSVDLTAEEYYARMDQVRAHRTAAPSVGEWLETMQRAVDDGAEALLVVCLAASLSGTYNSARLAAEAMTVPTEVVDSKSAAAAEGLYVRRLAEEARAGASLDQLVERANLRRGSYHLEFVLSGLDRLARSGRMPAAMARIGDAVHVRPMLTLGETGEVRPTGAARSLARGMERIYGRVLDAFPPGTPGRAAVTHALLDDEADEFVRRLRAERPDLEVDLVVFTPVMGANTGPIMGIAWEDPALAAASG